MMIIKKGHMLSHLAQKNVLSRRLLNPINIINAPIISGQVLLPLPPKHKSSSQPLSLLYLGIDELLEDWAIHKRAEGS
jgi:hypothetical protein